MLPDDKRHGTSAGYIAGCRELCCWKAKQRYDKQRRLEVLTTGQRRIVPTWRALRRIQALQAIGWSMPRIAQEVGRNHRHLYSIGRHPTIYRSTFEDIDAAYQRLSLTTPPATTIGERSGVTKAKRNAERNGWLPPMAWVDIDNPDEQPDLSARDDSVDEVVVLRILGGEYGMSANRAERFEVLRRWPESDNELERATGWNIPRMRRDMRTENAA